MYKNESKYQRAKAACGPEGTPEQIHAKYLELGGLFIDETGEKEVVADEAVADSVGEKPKRGKK